MPLFRIKDSIYDVQVGLIIRTANSPSLLNFNQLHFAAEMPVNCVSDDTCVSRGRPLTNLNLNTSGARGTWGESLTGTSGSVMISISRSTH